MFIRTQWLVKYVGLETRVVNGNYWEPPCFTASKIAAMTKTVIFFYSKKEKNNFFLGECINGSPA